MANTGELQTGVTGQYFRGTTFERLTAIATDNGQVEINREDLAKLVTEAYKAGVIAMAGAARVREIPRAKSVLLLQADLSEIALQITDDNPLEELAPDSVPSFVTLADHYAPEFDSEHMAGTAQLTEQLIDNFRYMNDVERQRLATKMALNYAYRIKGEGTAGRDLLQQTLAFERKQLEIINTSIESGQLRQPDQDYHTFLHYQQDIFHAWLSLNDESRHQNH